MNYPILLLTAAFLSCPCPGAVIFSTFGPGDSFNPSNDGVTSTTIGGTQNEEIAIRFIPVADSLLTGFRVAAFHLTGMTQLNIVLSTGVLPSSAIETFTISNIPDIPTIFSVQSALQPLLTSGATYWLAFSVPWDGISDPNPNDIELSWNDQAIPSSLAVRRIGIPFRPGTTLPVNGLAFDISADPAPTPEPFSLSLAATGLLAIAAGRSIQKRK